MKKIVLFVNFSSRMENAVVRYPVTPSETDEDLIYGYTASFLSDLFTPKDSKQCNKVTDLQVEDNRFLSYAGSIDYKTKLQRQKANEHECTEGTIDLTAIRDQAKHENSATDIQTFTLLFIFDTSNPQITRKARVYHRIVFQVGKLLSQRP